MTPIEVFFLLLLQAIQIAILAVIVRMVTRLVAGKRPHLAHALWAIVLIKCLTPPVWSSSCGLFSQAFGKIDCDFVERQLSETFLGSRDTPPLHAETVMSPAQLGSGRLATSMWADPVRSDRMAGQPLQNIPTKSQPTGKSRQRPMQRPLLVVAFLWGCGTIAGFTFLAIRFAVFWRSLRGMRLYSSPDVEDLTAQLSRQLGIRRRVQVVVVEGAIGPAVVGWFHPKVLLPARLLEGKSHDQLRPLIAHELIHVRRGDLWWAGLQEFCKCVWWFHPLVWSASRHLTQEAERCCDQETIAGLRCQPTTYARCLLDVLEHKNLLRAAPAFPGIRPIDVTRNRMEKIMCMDVNGCQRTPLWVWSVMVLLAVTVMPGAVVVRAQDQSPEASPQRPSVPKKPAAQQIYSSPATGSDQTDADTRPSRKEMEPMILRVYEIQELINKVSQQIGNSRDAEQCLLGVLPLSGNDPLGRDLSFLVADETVHLGGKEPRALIRSGKLYVFDRGSVHDQVQRQVDRLELHGIDLVRVQTSLMLVPAEKWSELEIPWKPASRATDQANGGNQRVFDDPSVSSIPSELQPAVVPALAPARPFVADGRDVAPTPAIPATESHLIRQASATTIVQESPSLTITIVDSDPSREIVKSIPGATILSCPQVVTLSGRSANVEVSRLTPMIVGYKTRIDDASESPIEEAVVEQVQVGTRMNLRPVLVDGRYVHLDFDLGVTRIHDLNQVRTSASADSDAPLRPLQTMATSTIQSALRVPVGAVLAIGGTAVEQNGKSYRLLCMVRCDKMDDSQELAP